MGLTAGWCMWVESLLLSLWDWLLVGSCTWNHRASVSLFTLYYVLKVHPCCNTCHNFLFKGWIISLCMRIPTFGLAIHSLMNVWIASTSWLLWIMLLWTSVCNLFLACWMTSTWVSSSAKVQNWTPSFPPKFALSLTCHLLSSIPRTPHLKATTSYSWRREHRPTLVFWPGEFHREEPGRLSPWDQKELDMIEWLSHTS